MHPRLTLPIALALFATPLASRADELPPDAGPVVVAAAPPDLTGRGWSGYWISDKNGHHGPLHATFNKVSDNCYRVRFSGRFWKVFPFLYSVHLTVTGTTGDAVLLSGATPLGPVLGSFRYDATATATHFEARFSSKSDCGRFVLCRTCP